MKFDDTWYILENSLFDRKLVIPFLKIKFNPQNPRTNSTMVEFVAKIRPDARCIIPPYFPVFRSNPFCANRYAPISPLRLEYPLVRLGITSRGLCFVRFFWE